MSDIYQFNVGGTTYNLANLGLLAPVQITLTADRLYNTGDQFIYTGLLYEATETIAQGTSITIGSNAQLADCVTKQISEINSNLTSVDVVSAFNVTGMSGAIFQKCNNCIYGLINWQGDGQTTHSFVSVIPTQYRPLFKTNAPVVNLSTALPVGNATFNTNGDIYVYMNTAIPTNQYGNVTFAYYFN